MVLGIALRNMDNQGTVVGQELGGDVNGLGMPDLTVFEAVLLLVESGQEAQLRSNAEVRHYHVEGLVQKLVF